MNARKQVSDFHKLWVGQTVSQLGSFMGALQFVAVLALGATPLQMGALGALSTLPGIVFGLYAGVLVDTLSRKRLIVVADFGRAALLSTVAFLFAAKLLRIGHLYLVGFLMSALSILFDTAYRSLLPSLVPKEQLVMANSRLTASESVVEVTGFSVGGWIAQLFGAISLVVFDAATFLFSGVAVASIRHRDGAPVSAGPHVGALKGIREGLAAVWTDKLLRTIVLVAIIEGIAGGMIGALILLYGIELGFHVGVLGSIFALGGLSALVGSIVASRVTRRLGRKRSMSLGLLFGAIGSMLIPLARGSLPLAGGLLALHQLLGDGPVTVYEINRISLIQERVPDRLLGRVNSSLRVAQLAALSLGSLVAGVLGSVIGLRASLWAAGSLGLTAWIVFAASPAGRTATG